MKRIYLLLAKISYKLQEHVMADQKLTHGFHLGTCIGATDIMNELTTIFAHINWENYPPKMEAEKVFKHFCPNIPFDPKIEQAMNVYANQLKKLFEDVQEDKKINPEDYKEKNLRSKK